jgi:chromatin assembly factor 1 subunit B
MPEALTPQITWHGQDDGKNAPVNSVDFHPHGVMATGGADNDIQLWRIVKNDKGKPLPEYILTLSGHQRAVNAVRFSPNCECLASASDDGTVLVWRRNPSTTGSGWTWGQAKEDREITRTNLR